MADEATTPSRLTTGVLLLLSAGLAALGLLVVSQRMELATLRDAAADQEADDRTLLRESRNAVSALRQELAAKAKAPTPPKPADLPHAASEKPWLAFAARLGDPAYHEAVRKGLRVYVDEHYGLLLRTCGLPFADRSRYEQLLVDRLMAQKDAAFIAMSQNVYPGEKPEQFQHILEASLRPVNADIEALVGEDGLAALAQYEKTGAGRELVDTLSGELAAEAQPLSDEQALRLGIVFTAQPRARLLPSIQPSEDGAFTSLEAPSEPQITEEALGAAARFLTPAQLSVFKERQALQRQVANVLRRTPGS